MSLSSPTPRRPPIPISALSWAHHCLYDHRQTHNPIFSTEEFDGGARFHWGIRELTGASEHDFTPLAHSETHDIRVLDFCFPFTYDISPSPAVSSLRKATPSPLSLAVWTLSSLSGEWYQSEGKTGLRTNGLHTDNPFPSVASLLPPPERATRKRALVLPTT